MTVEIVEIAKEADYENNFALTVGDIAYRAAQIALWFKAITVLGRTPHTLILLGASFALWAIYEFLIREWLRNSPIEIYIQRSLFYKERVGLRRFDATILAELLGKEDMDLSSPNEVRASLAKLCDDNPFLYDRAFNAELTECYAAIMDYRIEIEEEENDRASLFLNDARIKPDRLLKPTMAIINDCKQAYLLIGKEGDAAELKPIWISSPYDIVGEIIQSDPRNIDAKAIGDLILELYALERNREPSLYGNKEPSLSNLYDNQEPNLLERKESIKRKIYDLRNKDYGDIPAIEETLKNSSLIIVTQSIRLKYEISYSFKYKSIREDRFAQYKGQAVLSDPSIPRIIDVKVITATIDKCKLTALTQEENALIDARHPNENTDKGD
jgi:hypothetical protein